MKRLCQEALGSLPENVTKPAYDLNRTDVGIVHLGIGAFHRAHQACYIEKILNSGGGDWRIIGASLRSPGVREQLRPQNGLYTLIEKSGDSKRYQVIGAIKQVMVGPEDPLALVAKMADPAIRLITLTVTEKGYCHDPASGQLQFDHPGIEHDLTGYTKSPVTAIGYLVASLSRRKQEKGEGITIMSCDNLSGNGQLLRRVIMDFALRVDKSLVDWIERKVTFPGTMVDRIVPSTRESDLRALAEDIGVVDRGAVVTEPFSQWIIENCFAQPMPDWKNMGALLVDDVLPYEDLKLRLLNGTHSIIAYLGNLAGYEYVHEVIKDKDFSSLIEKYMDQTATTLLITDRDYLYAYKKNLMNRFLNQSLKHRTIQIAQDGSQKIPQRWLYTVRKLDEMNQSTEVIALAIAGWIHFLEKNEIDDPMVHTISGIFAKYKSEPSRLVKAILSIQTIFDDMIECNPNFVKRVDKLYGQLKKNDVRVLIRQIVRS